MENVTIIRVMMELEDGTSFCHQGKLRDCIYDSIEWIDYPRSAIETHDTLPTLSYFITDGIVNIGDVLEYAHVQEFEEDAPCFFWGDDIPKDAFSVERFSATVTDIKEFPG